MIPANIFISTYRFIISTCENSCGLSYENSSPGFRDKDRGTSVNGIIRTIEDRRHKILEASLITGLPLAFTLCLAAAICISPLAGLFAAIPSSVFSILTCEYIFDKKFFLIILRYRLSEEDRALYASLTGSVTELMSSDHVWLVDSVSVNRDKKHHGASTEIYERRTLHRHKHTPPWIITSLKVPSLRRGPYVLYLFPDFILIKNRRSYKAVPYRELLLHYAEKAFIEYEFMPRDARVLRTTWLHPNKNGTPDRRFKDNPEIPVMLYGYLTLSTYAGHHIRLLISDIEKARRFAALLGSRSGHYEEHPAKPAPEKMRKKQKEKESPFSSTEERDRNYWEQRHSAYNKKKNKKRKKDKHGNVSYDHSPYRVLGVSLEANVDEIKRAYRLLAKKYHPDRYAAKNRDRAEGAGEIFKKITRAYETITKMRRDR